MVRPITTLGKYLMLMGRVFARPERFRMYLKQYRNEMAQLGINSIGIVLLISFFIGIPLPYLYLLYLFKAVLPPITPLLHFRIL